MRQRLISIVAGLVLASISAFAVAQPYQFRPNPAACSDNLGSPPPGFDTSPHPTLNRFDLAYSTTSNRTLDVIFTSKTSGGKLVFIGSEHVVGSDRGLFDHIESVFNREKPIKAYVEVVDVSYLSALPSEESVVVATRGEPSYVGFIARKSGVVVLPLEPQPAELFRQLRQTLPIDQITLAFILRDVQLARDRGRLHGEALERAAMRSISQNNQLNAAHRGGLRINNILDLTRTVNRLWPGLDWRQVPAQWANPLLSSQDTGSKFVNAVFLAEMKARDAYALNLLLTRVAAGESIFALAGRTHGENHLQTLSCWMSKG
jgi:hypothetical protein